MSAKEGSARHVQASNIAHETAQALLALDGEFDLAGAITAHTKRDLFEGVTDAEQRKARCRIALIVDKLESVLLNGRRLDVIFQDVYGEAVRLPTATVIPTTKGSSSDGTNSR